jgi:regulatory protein
MSDFDNILAKAMRYCSSREVCSDDMLKKLAIWSDNPDYYNEIINKLIEEKFIDNQRYANAFVNDKFKFNHWGKIKIKRHLLSKKIPDSFIYNALQQIDNEEYMNIARKLFISKLNTLDKQENMMKKKQKLYSFLANKGYETEIIFTLLEEYF